MPYLRDAKGNLVPLAAIKAQDLLMDETVRRLLDRAQALSNLIAAFKLEAFENVAELQALMAQHYGAKLGGGKGNITLLSFDGCQKAQVQVSDLIEFGPELQAAKTIIDECLTEWAVGGAVELRTLVTRVFQVGKDGQINRAELLMLLRYDIDDPRWKRAMEAIKDSIRIIGSREYIRFYQRPTADGQWRGVTIDIASAPMVRPAADRG
nr:DUF3164 family protein [Sphingomonas sp. CFBP 8760]